MAEIELPEPEELEEKRTKPFAKRVALTTAIFAVLLAITSLGGSNAMKEMLLAQQQASDQWAFYQAKVIREHLYRQQKERLAIDLLERQGTLQPDIKKRLEAHLKKLGDEEQRFQVEKKDIKKAAEKLEHERDINRAKDPYFDYAEVLLQIAIVMASISILATSRSMFIFALVAASLGAVLSVNGFLLLFRLPLFH